MGPHLMETLNWYKLHLNDVVIKPVPDTHPSYSYLPIPIVPLLDNSTLHW